MFHISDFHNLKIVNNIFFFIFEMVLYFCLGVYKNSYKDHETAYTLFYSIDSLISNMSANN